MRNASCGCRWVGLFLVALSLAFAAREATAVNVTWNVAGGGDWDTTTANWTGDNTVYTEADNATFNNAAGGVINLTANRAPGSTTVSATSGTYTFSGGNITSGTLNKSGAGTLVLNSAITGGNVAISAGTVRLGASERIPNNVNPSGYVNYTFDMNGFDETLSGLTGFPVVTNMGNLTLTAGGDTAGGSMSGPGSLTVTGGLHTFRHGGAGNSWTGGTFITGGSIQIYNTVDGLPVTGAVTVSSPGLLNLNFYETGESQTIGALNGNGSVRTSSANTSGAAFRIGNGDGSGSYSGVFSGNGSLTKLGTGTQILNGNNTYTGTTTVSGGTLVVNGTTGVGQGNYLVSSGATLGGSGIINLAAGNNVTIANGGILAPGNSAGTLTINGGLVLNSGSFLNFELGAINASDKIVATDLTLDGTLNLSALPGFGAGTYDLIAYTGNLIDNGLELGTVPGGGLYSLQFTPGLISLNVLPVPEPSTVVLLGMGLAGLGWQVRRRRVQK